MSQIFQFHMKALPLLFLSVKSGTVYMHTQIHKWEKGEQDKYEESVYICEVAGFHMETILTITSEAYIWFFVFPHACFVLYLSFCYTLQSNLSNVVQKFSFRSSTMTNKAYTFLCMLPKTLLFCTGLNISILWWTLYSPYLAKWIIPNGKHTSTDVITYFGSKNIHDNK